MNNVVEIFQNELYMITDEAIREFVVTVLKKLTPDYFTTVAASTSGAHHPQIALGVGGLVRHTKLAVWWAVKLMDMDPPDDDNYWDEVIAATILHDLLKNGDKLTASGKPTLPDSTASHGIYLAGRISWLPIGDLPWLRMCRLISAINNHMGRWTAGRSSMSTQYVDRIVHMADYCASRKVDAKVAELSG